MVPTVKRLFLRQKQRRISIEIRTLDPEAESVRRVFLKDLLSFNFDFERLNAGESVRLQIFRERRESSHSEDHDDNTSVSSSVDYFNNHHHDDHSLSTLGDHGPEEHHHSEWQLLYSFHLDDFEILKTDGKVIEVSAGSRGDMVVRDIKFDTEKEAAFFKACRDRMTELIRERAQRQIAEYKLTNRSAGSTPSQPRGATRALLEDVPGTAASSLENMDEIKILVEIVGAENLPVGDIYSSDPYVVVRLGSMEIHRTEIVTKNLHPIWTLRTGSLFLLKVTPEQFFQSARGLSFAIKDFDQVGKNDTLGNVHVSHEELLAGTGERVEFPVIPERASDQQKGKLALRFKPATAEDIDFMDIFEKSPTKMGVFANETYLPLRPPESKFLKGQTKRGRHKDGSDTLVSKIKAKDWGDEP